MNDCVYSESGLKRSSQVDIILYKTCILTGLVRLWAGSCLLRCLRDMRRREKKWFLTQLSLLNGRGVTCLRKYGKCGSSGFLVSCAVLRVSPRLRESTRPPSPSPAAQVRAR